MAAAAEQAAGPGPGPERFTDFCDLFVTHFVDETDPAQRFERFARLMVEELGRPGAAERYVGDDAYDNLRAALRPTLEQEGLWVIAPAFFGGVSAEDTELLLDEFADYAEDPQGYEGPNLELDMDYWDPEDDEEEGQEGQEGQGGGNEAQEEAHG
jgi:hypothetical protein